MGPKPATGPGRAGPRPVPDWLPRRAGNQGDATVARVGGNHREHCRIRFIMESFLALASKPRVVELATAPALR